MKKINSSTKRKIFGAAALAVMLLILALPAPSPIDTGSKTIALSLPAKASLAVLSLAVILWVTEAVAFPVTGLLAMTLLVITKAAPFKELVTDGFGNHIILFFIGVLILSAAISQTGLLRRLSTYLLFHLGHKPKSIIMVFLTVGALMSGWITDMAVAAIMLPIGVSILKDAKIEPLKSNFGRALMISCAWGPLIGGITTPAGCGPNPLTMGFLKDLAGIDFSFTDWMLLGFPAAIMMLPLAWLILLKVFPLEEINLKITKDDFSKKLDEIGPFKRKELLTSIIFLITVFLWVCAPLISKWTAGKIDYLSISFVAIFCGCLFFLPGIGVIEWKTAEKQISWGGIILIVSGLSLGMTIYKTGAAEWLSWVVFNKIGLLHPIMIVFVVVFGVSLMKVMFSSNTVTGIIIVPLIIALAKNLDLDPTLVAIPAGITASLAFILVTSTPTNVIPYSAGYFTISDMAKAGIFMTIASSICVTISICLIGKIFGIVNF
jgi:solute carrier family 13 (sodium-dependent dicarboxylate transporter), member 2/3/5